MTNWVNHPPATSALFNSVVPFLPQGFKAVKGRLGLLRWVNNYRQILEAKQASLLISSIMDCLTDRVSNVRIEAMKTVEILAKLCPSEDFEKAMKDRPSPDVRSLRNILETLVGPSVSQRVSATSDSAPSAQPSELEQRKKALAMRPGVRILTKPKAGEGLKARYSNAKSSIPKPLPRMSIQRRSIEPAHPVGFLNSPSERSSVISISNSSIFLSYPVLSKSMLSFVASVKAE